MKIRYSYEENPLGTAGPLSLIKGLNESFMMMNGDILTTLDFCDLLEYHQEMEAIATIAMHPRQVNVDMGVLQCNDCNEIIGYTEKPTFDFLVSMGIYILEPRVLSYIPEEKYLDFPELILELLNRGERVVGYPFEGYWQDLGCPDDYEQAVQDFDELKPRIFGEE